MVLTSCTAPPLQENIMAALAHLSPTVVIRAARGSDGPALPRLAELDSHDDLTGDVLIAETYDEVVAALSRGPPPRAPPRRRRRPPPRRGRGRPNGGGGTPPPRPPPSPAGGEPAPPWK